MTIINEQISGSSSSDNGISPDNPVEQPKPDYGNNGQVPSPGEGEVDEDLSQNENSKKIITNDKIEFSYIEELNDYLTRDEKFQNTNYLITKIGGVWTVVVPKGYIDDNTNVIARTTFDVSHGIDKDDNNIIWKPSSTNTTSNSEYVCIKSKQLTTDEESRNCENLTTLTLSYITSATFKRGNISFDATNNSQFSSTWKTARENSYKITKINTWGVNKTSYKITKINA